MNILNFTSQKLYIKEQYKLNGVLCRLMIDYREKTRNICVHLLNDVKHDKLVLV